jgi:uncharacterized protein
MSNTFDWIEIRTHHLAETAHFYASLFGWKVTGQETVGGTDVWLFDTGGEPRLRNLRRGGMWMRPEGEPVGIVVYIVVENIEATLKRAVELGGKLIHCKAPLGGGYGACLRDPDGNLLGLYEDRKE